MYEKKQRKKESIKYLRIKFTYSYNLIRIK